MATPQIIASRTLDATRRLETARRALQDELGIDFTDGPVTNKDAAVARAQSLENTAGFLESLLPAVKQLKQQATPLKGISDVVEPETPEETAPPKQPEPPAKTSRKK